MKKQSLTYFLIVSVLVIWGGIFYKFFSGFFFETGVAPKAEVKEHIKYVNSFEEEEPYALIASGRDPFLGDIILPKNTLTVSKGAIKVKKKEKPKIDWTFIRYLGSIQNSKIAKNIALVNIHNKEYMIDQGQTIDGLKCIKNHKDSILVSFQGEITWIKK